MSETNVAVFLESPVAAFRPADPSFARFAAALRPLGASASLARSEEAFLHLLPAATHALVWTFRQEWFSLAPRLRAVCTPAAGRDYFSVVPPPGVSLSYGSFHGAILGETAAAAVLSLSHCILQGASLMKNPPAGGHAAEVWPRPFYDARARRLAGSTVSIVGFGAIGRAAGRFLKPFGPRVLGVSRSAHPAPEWFGPGDESLGADALDRAVAAADFILAFLPSGAGTDGVFDARRLALAKPSAYFLDYGRGNCVDEAALAAALREGRLAGAVLDVFREEPLPAESPLRGAPNCWLYPHSSAFSPDYLDLFFDEFVDRLRGAEGAR